MYLAGKPDLSAIPTTYFIHWKTLSKGAVIIVERVIRRTFTSNKLIRQYYGRLTVQCDKSMILLILFGLVALLALGIHFVGMSVGYLGLAFLTMLVIVVLVLATAHEEAQ